MSDTEGRDPFSSWINASLELEELASDETETYTLESLKADVNRIIEALPAEQRPRACEGALLDFLTAESYARTLPLCVVYKGENLETVSKKIYTTFTSEDFTSVLYDEDLDQPLFDIAKLVHKLADSTEKSKITEVLDQVNQKFTGRTYSFWVADRARVNPNVPNFIVGLSKLEREIYGGRQLIKNLDQSELDTFYNLPTTFYNKLTTLLAQDREIADEYDQTFRPDSSGGVAVVEAEQPKSSLPEPLPLDNIVMKQQLWENHNYLNGFRADIYNHRALTFKPENVNLFYAWCQPTGEDDTSSAVEDDTDESF